MNEKQINGFLNIKSNGSARFTKNRVGLDWNELSIAVNIKVPQELFRRPILSANIEIGKDVVPKPQPVDLILNTKELIEQSTGAKIEFTVKPYAEEEGSHQ